MRELSIVYGPVTVGGISTEFLLDGFTRHAITDGKAQSFVEFDAVIVSGTAAGLASKCASLERVFRTPRLSLTVVQSGVKLLEAAHGSASGGFNTEPEIRKVGDVGDSGRSRRYTIRIQYQTPADTATTSGLRESVINVEYDASRIRTIRISGTFTAVPGTSTGRARYAAAIAAHVSAVLSGLGVTTSELVGEPVAESDYDDKVLRFERRYREIIFGQGQDSASDDPDIVDQRLTVSRREISEERSPVSGSVSGGGVAGSSGSSTAGGQVQALAVFDLRYEANIVSGVDPKAKYDAIRAWLVGQFTAVFSQGSFALTVERPEVDRAQNRLVVDMTAEGAVRGADMVRRMVRSEARLVSGVVFRGAWTGNPASHYVYQGHSADTRTTTVTTRYLATKDAASAESESEEAAMSFGGVGVGSGILVEKSSSSMPVRIGIEGSGHVLDMLDATSTVITRKVDQVGGGGGGGGVGTNVPFGTEQAGPAIFAAGVAGAGNA